MTPRTYAPRFLSVRNPDLDLDEDDIALCGRCDGEGEVSGTIGGDGYGDRCCGTMDYEGECPTCDGYRIVHGYRGHGYYGLPVMVAPDSVVGVEATPEGQAA